MTVTIAGIEVLDAIFEIIGHSCESPVGCCPNMGSGIEIKITAPAFTAAQVSACCASIAAESSIACSDGTTNYSGTCSKVCCGSCGSSAVISCCG